ncbi:Soluble lytic murein transglycosylase [Bosea sp. TND4EK4]|nr:Soluble lytic murein transglycosylase [Bosea sp. TND4EK4]
MKYVYGGLAAAVLISLTGMASAEEFVNSETDPRAIVVRDAEIARLKAEEAKGSEQAAEAPSKPMSAKERRAARIEARKAKAEEVAAARQAAKAGGMKPQAAAATADAKVQEPTATASVARSEDKAEAKPVAAPAGVEGIKAIVARHAAANGVPFSLADAIIRVESRYNPRAAHAGNYGLMQIRHQTARGMGYSGGAGGLLDAETNARYGMKYLAEAYRMAGGDTCRTVMKYQSGHMATRLSGANRTYCAKVRTITARN